MHWTEKSKKAIIVNKKRKPKATLEKTRKPHKTPKPKNRSFFQREHRKTEPNIYQIRKTKYPYVLFVINLKELYLLPLFLSLLS